MKISEEKVSFKNYNYIRWTAVLSAFVLMLQMGLYVGWASPNYAWLVSEESPIQATISDISWIASLPTIGAIAGAILGSICTEYIGTRRTLLLVYLFIGISWSCLLVADSIEWIYASRIIGAIPLSVMQGGFSMYLGEILSPEIRGTLISLAQAGAPAGAVLSTVAETYLPMKISSSIYVAAALVGTMLLLWLRDTPYFLLKKNDLEGALQSIEFYHADKETNMELKTIQCFVEKTEPQSLKDRIRELGSPVIRRSMFAIIIVWGLPHLCGQVILLTYMQIILQSAKFNLVRPEEFVIYVILIKVTVAFIVVKLIDKLGRKILLIVSSVGTSITMFALGLYFYLLNANFDAPFLQWLPVVSIVLFFVSYAIGFLIVPSALLSEMFPEKLKSTAILLASISDPMFAFVVIKAYQPMIDYAGTEYAFWVHSILCLLGIPCAIFLIIETKGKSFQEIQSKLAKKWHV